MSKPKKPKPTNIAHVVPTLKKPKKTGKNAAQRKLDEDWVKMLASHAAPLEKGAKAKGITVQAPKTKKRHSKHIEKVSIVPPLTTPPGRESAKLPSMQTTGHSTAQKTVPKYTGTKMLGIGQMHKSNAVPVFREEDAEDIAKMRR